MAVICKLKGYAVITFHPLRTYEEWDWLQKRANPALSDDMKGIVAYRDNDLIAAVVMDDWSYNSVTAHIAIGDPLVLRHGFLEEVFNYMFITAGKGIVLGVCPADREDVLKFTKHVGFNEIYRVRDGYMVGIDYVIQELRKEDCRYLRKRDGKERYSCAA